MATDPKSKEAFADTSVWIAIILEEPGHEELADQLGEASPLWIAAPMLVEAMVVLERRQIPNGIETLERLPGVAKLRFFPSAPRRRGSPMRHLR